MSIQIQIQKKLADYTLDLSINTNASILGILGASGSGKSMTLKCIAGLVKPDKGYISINDNLFYHSDQHINIKTRHRKIGYVFQNYALFPHLTVEENIAFGINKGQHYSASHLMSLISKLHLSGLENKYPAQISGGQQQRVAIARALATNPDLLLLDEPFSALDEHLRKEMLKEMAQYLSLFKVKTFYVTHQMEEAYYLCDDIAIIKQGKIDDIGEKNALFSMPKTFEAAKITGCKNFSAIKVEGPSQVFCEQWGIRLNTSVDTVDEISHNSQICIRNQHLKLAGEDNKDNCFKAWVADIVKTPTLLTLYIKFNNPPFGPEDYHIQMDVSHEKRVQIGDVLFVEIPNDKVCFLP